MCAMRQQPARRRTPHTAATAARCNENLSPGNPPRATHPATPRPVSRPHARRRGATPAPPGKPVCVRHRACHLRPPPPPRRRLPLPHRLRPHCPCPASALGRTSSPCPPPGSPRPPPPASWAASPAPRPPMLTPYVAAHPLCIMPRSFVRRRLRQLTHDPGRFGLGTGVPRQQRTLLPGTAHLL